VAASVVALAMPARADDLPTIDTVFPPTVRVGAPGYNSAIDRIAVDVRAATISWITIEVRSRRFAPRAIVPVDVPAGTRIVGMSVSTHGVRSWSAARRRQEAIDDYRSEPEASLLAWEGTSADQDHVRIEVDGSARIELAVELPPIPSLAIDPDGHEVASIETTVLGRDRQQWRRRRERVELDLRGIPAHVAADPYAHVDAQTWLVAGAPNRNEPRIEHRFPRPPHGIGEAPAIRAMMRLNLGRFEHCYELYIQTHPTAEGDVAIQFFIPTSGEVTAAVAAGLAPEIDACVVDVVKAWPFGPVDTPTQVNYPLHFRVAG
jgi:hypothetical protein